jgi:hypothetical protein
MDQSNYASMHKELFAGVSLNVSGGVVGAGMDLAEAASKLDGENGKYAIAPAALAAYKAAKLGGSGASLIPSASLTVGFCHLTRGHDAPQLRVNRNPCRNRRYHWKRRTDCGWL